MTRQFERRLSLCQCDRTAGHQWNAQFPGGVVHALGKVPAIRQMLIREHWHDLFTLPKNGYDLIKEAGARIFDLPSFVLWILSVLANRQHCVDTQRVATAAKRVV